MFYIGMYFKDQGEHSRAKRVLEASLEVCITSLGPQHRRTLALSGNLANLYGAMGDEEASERLLKKLVGECERTLGPEHNGTLTATMNLALSYRSKGDLAAAEKLLSHVVMLEVPDHQVGARSLFE